MTFEIKKMGSALVADLGRCQSVVLNDLLVGMRPARVLRAMTHRSVLQRITAEIVMVIAIK